MSKPNPNLSHNTQDIARYVQHVAAMSYVSTIYIVGSRSPLSRKESRPDSDWDLMIERSGEGHIMQPRKWPHLLLADLMPYRERPDMVEIWPEDKHGILKNG